MTFTGKEMKKFYRTFFGALTLSMMIVIFCFSSQSGEDSATLSNGLLTHLLNLLYPGFKDLPYASQLNLHESLSFIIRKTAHFSIYTSLGIFSSAMMCTYQMKNLKRVLISLSICVCYAASDEIHQLFSSGRSCELRDVIIDSIGATVGILLTMLIFSIINRKKAKVKNG